jgi:hypothetical protein
MLETAFTSLKKSFDESATFATNVRTSMEQFGEERKHAVENLKSGLSLLRPFRVIFSYIFSSRRSILAKPVCFAISEIEPLLNEDGEYVKGNETKSLVSELQVEWAKSTFRPYLFSNPIRGL